MRDWLITVPDRVRIFRLRTEVIFHRKILAIIDWYLEKQGYERAILQVDFSDLPVSWSLPTMTRYTHTFRQELMQDERGNPYEVVD